MLKKQDWWNEFDRKRNNSVEKLANYAIAANDYEDFITGAFCFDDLIWVARSDEFVKLCKAEEKKNSVPEYDLSTTYKVVAIFYTNGINLTVENRKQLYDVLKTNNISYDCIEYNTKEKSTNRV